MSLDSDCSVTRGGSEDHRWRASATDGASTEGSMPDDSSAEDPGAVSSSVDNSSAEDPSAGNSSAESRARGKNRGGCEPVCGGVRVNMLETTRCKRSASRRHNGRAQSTADNGTWRASRAELSNGQNVILSCRRSWNNWVAGRAELGNGLSRACWFRDRR